MSDEPILDEIQQAMKPDTCVWTRHPHGEWTTGCAHSAGMAFDGNIIYCGYCGKKRHAPIDEQPPTEAPKYCDSCTVQQQKFCTEKRLASRFCKKAGL